MNNIELILVAISLSMDAFAVAISQSMNANSKNFKNAIIIAGFFGAFQAIMPFIGFYLGKQLKNILSFNHIISFILLSIIGVRMIYEAINKKNSMHDKNSTILNIPSLFILSIATSIDACGYGLSLSFLQNTIFYPITIIGLISFVISFIGVRIGEKLNLNRKIAEVLGGSVLIGIAFKILIF